MNKNTDPRWLEWAKELQFIAQAGLTYSEIPSTSSVLNVSGKYRQRS